MSSVKALQKIKTLSNRNLTEPELLYKYFLYKSFFSYRGFSISAFYFWDQSILPIIPAMRILFQINCLVTAVWRKSFGIYWRGASFVYSQVVYKSVPLIRVKLVQVFALGRTKNTRVICALNKRKNFTRIHFLRAHSNLTKYDKYGA